MNLTKNGLKGCNTFNPIKFDSVFKQTLVLSYFLENKAARQSKQCAPLASIQIFEGRKSG